MTQRALPFTLHPKRSKMFLLFVLCSAFAAGGIWMIRDGEAVGWFVAGFFGLGVPVFLLQFFPKSSFLTVDEDGIEFAALFRKCRLKWREISEFGVYSRKSIGIGMTVGINYSASFERYRKMRAVNKALLGFEGALPDTYGLPATELATLLASYHAERA
jgi:hypothetical protein